MRLRAQEVVYAYVPGKPVLRGLSLEIQPGELLFLLGPNGSGKTTFLDCLGGLRRPLRGEVLLDSQPLFSLSTRERAKFVGYVPQFHEPPFNFTAWEVVLMGRAPYVRWLSQPGAADRRAADEALAILNLEGFRNRPYYTLSGGERRLVLVARGLAQGAPFLLLDEPDAHLDPANQHRVLTAVRRLLAEGRSVVITSHNPNNALLYADRVMVLTQGKAVVEGSPTTALTPSALYAAYGIAFEVVGDGQGPRAILPALDEGSERSFRSSSRERESGTGSDHSRSSSESRPAKANGA